MCLFRCDRAAFLVASLSLVLSGALRSQEPSGGSPPAPPGQSADVQKRLEEQARRIDELEKRIQETAPIPAPPEEKRPFLDLVHWNELSAGGSRFKLYGWLRLDGIYDDSRPNNTQVIGFVRSEDRTAPARIASPPNSEDLTIHPRLTRLGLDFDGPTVAAFNDAKITGKLEIDFYNNGLLGQSESREAIRMRHAYLKINWRDLFILAGQTNDVISPLYPVVNPDLVMWGAGNLGDRRPQLRAEYAPAVGPARSRLIFQGMVGLTGADNNQDLDSPNTFGAGFRDGEASGLPTLQGRMAYHYEMREKRSAELGVWGHRAWEHPEQRFGGKSWFDSYAYGLDLMCPVFSDLVTFKGEIWRGANVDDVRGGIFQGINTTTGAEIVSEGGWAELGFLARSWYLLSIGYSTDDPRNSQVGLGGRAANRIAYLSNRFYFHPIEIGFDYLYWVTRYVGFDQGDDNRFQVYIAYKF